MTTALSSPETAVNNGRATTCIPCGTAVGMTTSPRCASQGWDGCSPPWNSQCKELDFAIWLPGIARYGMEVNGGFYRVGRGVWHLITPTGEERKGSLLQMAKEGALQAPEGETAEGVPGWQILRPRHLYVRR